MNALQTEQPKPHRKGFWRSMFDWRMSAEELTEQVDGYATLGITKSYRKLSSMLLLFTVVLTAALGSWLGKMDGYEIVSSVIIYMSLAIFCFRGHRWALVVAMVCWTYEKGYSILHPVSASVGGNFLTAILWWSIYMSVFWKAFAVERARRHPQKMVVRQNAAID